MAENGVEKDTLAVGGAPASQVSTSHGTSSPTGTTGPASNDRALTSASPPTSSPGVPAEHRQGLPAGFVLASADGPHVQNHMNGGGRPQHLPAHVYADTTLTKVFVGGLAWTTRSEALHKHFIGYGMCTMRYCTRRLCSNE